MSDDDVRAAIASVRTWYHVLELAPGVLTPGVYDMRPHLRSLGLPERFEGLSVLDVGTSNGFFAFHFERHGAARVVASELRHITDHDLPRWHLQRERAALGEARLAELEHHELHGGFEVAHRALGSRVERVLGRVEELPGRLGERFDLVFCCNVLIHLRDPVGGLEALARVCRPDGLLVLATPVDLSAQAPYAVFRGDLARAAWWVPSAEGLTALARFAGWGDVRWMGSFRVPTTLEPPDQAGVMGVIHARRPAVRAD
jgi:tRNA (mo5U34)-methyltransferase